MGELRYIKAATQTMRSAIAALVILCVSFTLAKEVCVPDTPELQAEAEAVAKACALLTPLHLNQPGGTRKLLSKVDDICTDPTCAPQLLKNTMKATNNTVDCSFKTLEELNTALNACFDPYKPAFTKAGVNVTELMECGTKPENLAVFQPIMADVKCLDGKTDFMKTLEKAAAAR